MAKEIKDIAEPTQTAGEGEVLQTAGEQTIEKELPKANLRSVAKTVTEQTKKASPTESQQQSLEEQQQIAEEQKPKVPQKQYVNEEYLDSLYNKLKEIPNIEGLKSPETILKEFPKDGNNIDNYMKLARVIGHHTNYVMPSYDRFINKLYAAPEETIKEENKPPVYNKAELDSIITASGGETVNKEELPKKEEAPDLAKITGFENIYKDKRLDAIVKDETPAPFIKDVEEEDVEKDDVLLARERALKDKEKLNPLNNPINLVGAIQSPDDTKYDISKLESKISEYKDHIQWIEEKKKTLDIKTTEGRAGFDYLEGAKKLYQQKIDKYENIVSQNKRESVIGLSEKLQEEKQKLENDINKYITLMSLLPHQIEINDDNGNLLKGEKALSYMKENLTTKKQKVDELTNEINEIEEGFKPSSLDIKKSKKKEILREYATIAIDNNVWEEKKSKLIEKGTISPNEANAIEKEVVLDKEREQRWKELKEGKITTLDAEGFYEYRDRLTNSIKKDLMLKQKALYAQMIDDAKDYYEEEVNKVKEKYNENLQIINNEISTQYNDELELLYKDNPEITKIRGYYQDLYNKATTEEEQVNIMAEFNNKLQENEQVASISQKYDELYQKRKAEIDKFWIKQIERKKQYAYEKASKDANNQLRKYADKLYEPKLLDKQSLEEEKRKILLSDEWQTMSYADKKVALRNSWSRYKKTITDENILKNLRYAEDEYYYQILKDEVVTPTGETSLFGIKMWAENTLDLIDEEIKKVEQKLAIYTAPFVADKKIANYSIDNETNNKYVDFEIISKELQQKKETLENAKDNLKNILNANDVAGYDSENLLKDFAKGLTSLNGINYIPYLSTLNELGNGLNVYTVLKKQSSGEELSLDEQMLLESFGALQQTEAIAPDNMAFNVGRNIANMLPYIGEFALSSGAFSAGKTFTQKALLNAVSKGFVKSAKKSIPAELGEATTKIVTKDIAKGMAKEKLSEGVAKYVTEGASYFVGTLAQTSINPQQYLNNIVDRMTPQVRTMWTDEGTPVIEQLDGGEDWEVAFAKGFGMTWAEFATEQLGSYIMKIPKTGGNIVNKIINNPEWFKRSIVGGWMKKRGVKTVKDAYETILKEKLGWHGVMEEYLEEFVNSRITSMITGDRGAFDIDKKEELETFLTTAVFGGVVKAPKAISVALKDNRQIVKVKDDSGKIVTTKIKPKTWEKFTSLLNEGTFNIKALEDFLNNSKLDDRSKEILTKIYVEANKKSEKVTQATEQNEKLKEWQKGEELKVDVANETPVEEAPEEETSATATETSVEEQPEPTQENETYTLLEGSNKEKGSKVVKLDKDGNVKISGIYKGIKGGMHVFEINGKEKRYKTVKGWNKLEQNPVLETPSETEEITKETKTEEIQSETTPTIEEKPVETEQPTEEQLVEPVKEEQPAKETKPIPAAQSVKLENIASKVISKEKEIEKIESIPEEKRTKGQKSSLTQKKKVLDKYKNDLLKIAKEQGMEEDEVNSLIDKLKEEQSKPKEKTDVIDELFKNKDKEKAKEKAKKDEALNHLSKFNNKTINEISEELGLGKVKDHNDLLDKAIDKGLTPQNIRQKVFAKNSSLNKALQTEIEETKKLINDNKIKQAKDKIKQIEAKSKQLLPLQKESVSKDINILNSNIKTKLEERKGKKVAPVKKEVKEQSEKKEQVKKEPKKEYKTKKETISILEETINAAKKKIGSFANIKDIAQSTKINGDLFNKFVLEQFNKGIISEAEKKEYFDKYNSLLREWEKKIFGEQEEEHLYSKEDKNKKPAPYGMTNNSGRRAMPKPSILGELPMSMNEIIKGIISKFNFTTFHYRTFAGKKVRGLFNVNRKVIYIKNADDIDTVLHEVGHGLSTRYKLLEKALEDKQVMKELRWFAQYGTPTRKTDEKIEEGIAEFTRAYVYDEKFAKEKAPKFTKIFEEALQEKDKKAIEWTREEATKYANSTPLEQAAAEYKSSSKKKNASEIVKTIIDGMWITSPDESSFNMYDKISAKLFNHLRPLEKFTRMYAYGIGVDELLPEMNPAIMARMVLGLNNRILNMLTDGMVNAKEQKLIYTDKEGNKHKYNINMLFGAMDNLSKDEIEETMILTGLYMISQRTFEIRDKKVKDKVEKKLKQLEKLSKQEFDKETRQMLENIVSQQIMSEVEQEPIVGFAKFTGETDIQKALEIVEQFKLIKEQYPERFKIIEENAERYRKMADATLQYLYDKGRISKEHLDKVRSENSYYVAMHRIIEDEGFLNTIGEKKKMDIFNGSSLGKAAEYARTKVKISKKQEGSRRKVSDVYGNLLSVVTNAYEEADYNEVKQTIVNLIKEYDKKNGTVTINELPTNAENVKKKISVYENGELKHYEVVDDLAWEAYNNMNRITVLLPKFLVLPLVADVMRWAITTTPAFLIRNIMRDLQSRLILLSGGFDKDTWKTYIPLLERQDYKNTVSELQQLGADQSTWYMLDKVGYDKLMKEELEKIKKKSKLEKIATVLQPVNMFDGYKKLLKTSEVITRVSAYKTEYKKYYDKYLDYFKNKENLSQEEAEERAKYNAMKMAAFEARDLMDFAVMGEWISYINQIIPFTNASIQGIRRTFKDLRSAIRSGELEKIGNLGIRFFTFAVLPTIIEKMMIMALDDDDKEFYYAQPAYLRDMFYLIKTPKVLEKTMGTKWIRIPKPFELGVIASGIGRAIDYAFEGKEKAFEGYFSDDKPSASLMEDVLSVGGGTFFKSFIPIEPDALIAGNNPLLDIARNQTFTGQQIVPYWEKGKKVSALEENERASYFSKKLAELNIAHPNQIDHLIKGFFSDWGAGALNVIDMMAGEKELFEDKEEKNRVVSFGMFGIGANNPARNSPDYQWLMKASEVYGISRNSKIFKPLRDAELAYKNAKPGDDIDGNGIEDRDEHALELIQRAKFIRMLIEENVEKLSEEEFIKEYGN